MICFPVLATGGGVVGCTTAYYLTRHPKFNPALHAITLLEAAPSLAAGSSGKAGGLLAQWAYPSCLVPLSYKLHAELADEHGGAQRWGYRQVQCGSVEAIVSKDKIQKIQQRLKQQTQQPSAVDSDQSTKEWEKLPKQDEAAQDMLRSGDVPADLDWIDADVIAGYDEMGAPGRTETAQVHPFHFTTSIGELAGAGGADMRVMAKVTDIQSSADGVKSVQYLDRTSDEVKNIADVTDVVVAAGPWTGRILPRAKVEGLRAHSVVYDAHVSAYAVFTNIQLPPDFVPEHRAGMGQKRRHKGIVDPEMYARPFGEVYACGESVLIMSSSYSSLPPSPLFFLPVFHSCPFSSFTC